MFRLALKNFWGAGLRTWLNILVLSIAYVAIVWLQGIFIAFEQRAYEALIAEEIGGGQIHHHNYDAYDPLSWENSISPLPQSSVSFEHTQLLIYPAVAYPYGRVHGVTLKGIQPEQKILRISSEYLDSKATVSQVLIGTRMARSTGLSEGDIFMIRWRNKLGALDAKEVQVAKVASMENQSIDIGQIWLPLEELRSMLQIENATTMLILPVDSNLTPDMIPPDWTLKTPYDLTAYLRALTAMADAEYYIFYIVLLFLAIISIFDTQILSLFRRRKEMGTLMSLGMTRNQLIGLFTLEGALYALFALVVGAVYGTPLLILTAKYGFPLPEGMDMDSFGIPGITDTIYPIYQLNSIALTISIGIVVVILVSYLPARRIAKLKPTDALRGKWS